MRLKSADGPLQAVHNRNNDILNSPKRINTVQNSNYIQNPQVSSKTLPGNLQNYVNTTEITNLARLTIEDVAVLNNIHNDTQELRWCNSDLTYNQQLNIQRQRALNGLSNNRLNINSNLAARLLLQAQNAPNYQQRMPQSPDDDEAHQSCSSSVSASPQDEDRVFDPSDSDEGNDASTDMRQAPLKGFVNPNYPGFQHLAHTLDFDEDLLNNANNNNNEEFEVADKFDSVNRLDSVENIQKVFHDKALDLEVGKGDSDATINKNFNIRLCEKLSVVGDFSKEVEDELNKREGEAGQPMEVDPVQNQPKLKGKQVPSFLPLNQSPVSPIENKMTDATLSNCEESISKIVMDGDLGRRDSNRELEEIEIQIKKIKSDIMSHMEQKKEDLTKEFKEKDEDSSLPRPKRNHYVKKRRDYNQQFGSLITFPKRDPVKRDSINRRSGPVMRDRKKPESLGGFDVYNIETAMPQIDLEAIECHLKAAREEERRRRTDREEIRRRLAMGNEDDYYTDRPGRKPSLQARLQSGMNLQICFMNETVSDNESPSSDNECPLTNPKPAKTLRQNYIQPQPVQRPATLSLHPVAPPPLGGATSETDFFTKQARLQTEARMALAQAKEMARMQMEIEKQRQKKSPITEMVRHSLEKVGIPFPEEKRRLSRQILTEMNVAQLQVIVNDLHTQIETLNEQLVKFLMDRDDFHMEQDSMLVDIEDLTRYLGAKEQVLKEQQLAPTPQNNNLLPPPSPAPSSPLATINNTVRPHLNRIANLVKK